MAFKRKPEPRCWYVNARSRVRAGTDGGTTYGEINAPSVSARVYRGPVVWVGGSVLAFSAADLDRSGRSQYDAFPLSDVDQRLREAPSCLMNPGGRPLLERISYHPRLAATTLT